MIKRTTVATSATFPFRFGDSEFRLGRDQTRTISPVAPGVYTVSESASAGWVLASLACTDVSGGTVSALADRRATIDVAAGETVTCIFTNRPAGTLPSTGGEHRPTVLIAALAVATGLLLTRWRRRLSRI